jgi:hypothetical protein
MKTYRWFGVLSAVFLSSGILDARATPLAGSGDPFTFFFDENGNGRIDFRDGTGTNANNGALAPDPTQAGNPLVLTYFLPGPIVNGDVRIWENANFTILSDVMRFTDASGNLTGQTADRMIFYSDRESGEPFPDLADTGIPSFLLPIDSGGIAEFGPEGTNSFQWAPGGPWDNIYNGISDVPEPGALSFLALGAAAWLVARRRSRRVMKVTGCLLAVWLLALPCARLTAQPFTVVNVIPNQFSGEDDQNSEPSIAVAPGAAGTNGVAIISSFGLLPGVMPDPDPNLGPNPYFITDGSVRKWKNFQNLPHGDTTLDWSAGGSAYAALGNLPDAHVRQKLGAVFGAPLPGSDYPPTGGGMNTSDQPWLIAVAVGGRDRLYVGINDGGAAPLSDIVWLYTDADPGGPSWRKVVLDHGGPLASGKAFKGDGVPVRLAANGNVVYVAFQRWDISLLTDGPDAHGDIVVCRDLKGGAHNFLDPGRSGRPLAPVATGITIPFNGARLGNNRAFERLGSDLSIAVDPNDPNRVYVAYCDVAGGPRLHVKASCDGGETWINNFFDVAGDSALPALAVAANDTVGLLYTAFDGVNLQTHFVQGLGSGPVDSVVATFPAGTPPPAYDPTGAPYIGDYEDLQAVGNTFYGAFAASNDPKVNNFPQGVFFQRNVLVGGVVQSNFVLTADGALANTNGLPLDNKWLQIPDTTTNGLDVRATFPRLLADDFLCNTSGPIPRITIWGSWTNNNVAPNTTFFLSLWSNVPAVGTNASHPGNRLWPWTPFPLGTYRASIFANVTNENFFDPDANAIIGRDTQIWQYDFDIPKGQQFQQTNGVTYWLAVSAIPWDGTGTNLSTTNLFGWKTCPTNWMDDGAFNAFNGFPTNRGPWQPLVRPATTNSLNLAFAIGAGVPVTIDPYFLTTLATNAAPPDCPASPFTNAVPQKWLQLPDTNGMDVRATAPKILADDFLCTASGPITQIKIWGSWTNDLNPAHVGLPPCFCLGIWSDVPAVAGNPSHPGTNLWNCCLYSNQYSFSIFTSLGVPGTNLVEEFFDPNTDSIIGMDNVIWQYTFDIPTNRAFIQTNGTIYWLSVYADCLATNVYCNVVVDTNNPPTDLNTNYYTNTFLFGWKTSLNHFKDDAVFGDLADKTGTNIVGGWQELIHPTTGQSLDLSFALGTPAPQTNAVLKWLQRPDLTPTGLDILAGNAANQAGAGIRVIADDFLCQLDGYVTDIGIWGSWLNDQVDPNASFQISFWNDVPAVGTNASHPGYLLWQWTFTASDYTFGLISSGVLEGFMDPSCPWLLRGNDTQVFQYDFQVPAPAAFFQTNGNIYWMSVQSCNTHLGLFGWKTCILDDRFNDDATWTWRIPPVWTDMHYPTNHPYNGLSIDMSFFLGTTVLPAGDPPPPGSRTVVRPVLSVAPSSDGGGLTILWAGSGILQSAPEVTGPWTDVNDASSPYTVPMDKPRFFYRVRVP